MRNKFLTGLFLVSIFFITSGCGSQQPDDSSSVSNPATSPNPKQLTETAANMPWQYRWLNNIPCRLPCWENIIPGQTSATEAQKILESNPLISSTEILTLDNDGEVKWYWFNGNIGGRLYFHTNTPNKVIYNIEPNYASCYKFSDVLKAFGEPDYIQAIAGIDYPTNNPTFYLGIIYSKIGLGLSSGGNNKPELPEI